MNITIPGARRGNAAHCALVGEPRRIPPRVERSSPIMRFERVSALVAALTMLSTAACFDGHLSAERTARETGALHGTQVAAAGAPYQSVGVVSGELSCSGTIIHEDDQGGIALVASHCFFDLGQRCATEEQVVAGAQFSVSLTGQSNDFAQTYPIDRVIVHPEAYFDFGQCLGTDANSCASRPSFAAPDGRSEEHDLAIVHFHVPPGGQSPGALGIVALPVITSIADSASTPFGVHASMAMADDFESPSSRTLGTPVGYGANDTGLPNTRYAAPMAFVYGTDSSWDEDCQSLLACDGPGTTPTPCVREGHAPVANTVLEEQIPMHRIEVSSGVFEGGAPDAGDSGGPLLVHAGRDLEAGDFLDLDSLLQPFPSGPYFVFGLHTTTDRDIGNGVPIGSADLHAWFVPTWTPGNGEWIERTVAALVEDTDGDGVANSVDNCPLVKNGDQANCNRDFEIANGQDFLGDACDPVPCPSPVVLNGLVADPTAPGCGTFTNTCDVATHPPLFQIVSCPAGCAPNADCITCQCCGFVANDTVVTTALQPKEASPAAAFGTGQAVTVSDTFMRFCQDAPNATPPIACGAAAVLSDAQLVSDIARDPNHPWHRVTVAGTGGLSTPPTGTFDLDVTSFSYDGTSSFGLQWLYQTDFTTWLSDPTHPVIVGCTSTSCLNGLWWVSAKTDVGTAMSSLAGTLGVHMPGNLGPGINIADGLTAMQPHSAGASWCPIPTGVASSGGTPHGLRGPHGWGTGKLVWLPEGSSLQLDAGNLVGDARFLAASASAGVMTAIQSDGSAIAAEDVGASNCGGAQVSQGIHDTSFAAASTWLHAVEPSLSIPGLPFGLVALSLDGTQVLSTARSVRGTLVEETLAPTTGDPPAPRDDYVATFSRSAGGVFVAGGKALRSRRTFHDVWFQALGGPWTDVTPHGGSSSLGVIRAITYSYADNKVWLVDEIPGAPHPDGRARHERVARLLRAAPGGDIEELATWQSDGRVAEYFLSVDHDGSALLSLAGPPGHGFVTARIRLDVKTDVASISAFYTRRHVDLLGPVFVSPVGYGFLVRDGHTLRVLRTQALEPVPEPDAARDLDESRCP
jgi:hypothetical protein